MATIYHQTAPARGVQAQFDWKQLFVGLVLSTGVWARAEEPAVRVAVEEQALVVSVPAGQTGSVRVVVWPAATVTDTNAAVVAGECGVDAGRVRVPRFEGGVDRLFSRIEVRDAGTDRVLAPPQWVTDVSGLKAPRFPFLRPATKKGVQCVQSLDDAKALGVGHLSVNLDINRFIDPRATNPATYVEVDGQRIGVHAGALAQLDREVKAATDAGFNLVGILLNYLPPKGRARTALTHPGSADAGIAGSAIGAFNVTSADGVRWYRAFVRLLAERYSREDRAHGWLSGFIIGNEVQAHWVWNNQGEVSPDEVVRDYHTALRLAWLEAQRAHAGLRVFVSMEHHWGMSASGFNGRRGMRGVELLEKLNAAAVASGNFPWHLAFHPYPENLFNPRFWNDRTATFQLNAPRITFRNLEVLPAFLRQERFLFAGTPRVITFTEQGFHSGKTPEDEQVQAAALAYGFRRVDLMPEVEYFIYHRHVDHPGEGGLKLGLLETSTPQGGDTWGGRRKPAWAVYQAAGTPDWERVSAFALPIIGLTNWAQVTLETNIAAASESGTTRDPALVFDVLEHAGEAVTAETLAFQPGDVLKSAGWIAAALVQHPTGKRSTAAWDVTLPAAGTSRLVLEFGTALDAPSTDGVRFEVEVDGRRVFEHEQTTRAYQPHNVDLTAFAGRKIRLVLAVDPRASAAHDKAAWAEPGIYRR